MLWKIRELLCDIIGYAYREETPDTIKKYKGFFLLLPEKDVGSFGGDCNLKTGKIRIMGTAGKEPWEILIVGIHECAHFIDGKKRGNSGHSKEFYEVYRKLIYAALDLDILEKADILAYMQRTNYSDRNKVCRMLKAYVPCRTSYKEDRVCISVYNAYPYREYLAANGYRWSKEGSCWTKELDRSLAEEEGAALCQNAPDAHWLTGPASRLQKKTKHYFVLTGNTFGLKDDLKKLGYFAKKESGAWVWRKELRDGYPLDDLTRAELLDKENELLRGFRDISIKIV